MRSINLTKRLLFFVTIIYVGKRVYNLLDDWTLERFEIESMEGAREILKEAALEHIEKFDGVELFTGKGYSSMGRSISATIGYTAEEKGAEADWAEMVGSYGYLIGGIFILFYIYFIFIGLINFLKYKNLENFILLFLVFLFVAIGYLAGHAMNNSMTAPLIAVVASLLLNKNIGINRLN